MVKSGTASELLKADQVEILRKIRAPDETKHPANESYQFCSKVEEYFKLDKKNVYKKIIDGNFVISPPEVTKTKQGTPCWQHGFQLVLEEQKEEGNASTGEYKYTGYLLHHAENDKHEYCGWLYRKRSSGARTNDLTKHLKRCCPGIFDRSVSKSQEIKSKQTKLN